MFPADIPDPNPEGLDLTSNEKRETILEHLPFLLQYDISASKALSYYQEHDMGIRASDFRVLYNSFFSNANLSQVISVFSGDYTLEDKYLGEGSSSDRGSYLYVSEVQYLDLTSDEMQTGYYGFYTDRLLSVSKLDDIFFDLATYSDSYRGAEVIDTHLIKAYKLEQ